MARINLTTNNLDQYEGYRIKQVGQEHIYLILDGNRHHIPNPATHRNLFGDSDTTHEVLDINIVPDGDALSNGAILARSKNEPHIYLVSNGQKRHVSSPEVMAKFGFDGDVQIVAQVLIDFIPTGNPII